MCRKGIDPELGNPPDACRPVQRPAKDDLDITRRTRRHSLKDTSRLWEQEAGVQVPPTHLPGGLEGGGAPRSEGDDQPAHQEGDERTEHDPHRPRAEHLSLLGAVLPLSVRRAAHLRQVLVWLARLAALRTHADDGTRRTGSGAREWMGDLEDVPRRVADHRPAVAVRRSSGASSTVAPACTARRNVASASST